MPPDDVMASIQMERSNRSLLAFTGYAWSSVEPKRKFQINWHHEAIAEHLEAVTRGEIDHLLMLVPPGSMKSLEVAVFWPAWEWGPAGLPDRRFIFASYAKHLSLRDSLRCRRVIRSPWYQSLWGNEYTMLEDNDSKTIFQNDKMGFRLATSTDSISTGERGDVVVADDPHNVKKVESEVQRQGVLDWWDWAMSSRVNDPEDSAFVIIMQRVHGNDLANHVVEEHGDYTVLKLPMEYEPGHRCFTEVRPKKYKGKNKKKYRWDPRKKENELMWPNFFTKKYVKKLKRKLGSYAAAAQLQQRPSPRGGGLIKMKWFQRYDTPPSKRSIIRLTQSWDTANKKVKAGKRGQKIAYSVCETWAETKKGHFLLHVYREKLDIPELERMVISMAKGWRPNLILVEEAASGVAIIQYVNEKTNYPVLGVHPEQDKVTRMDVETPTIEAGNIWLPNSADWLPEFEKEVGQFPATDYMDQVDSLSQYLKHVREHEAEVDWNLY